MKFRVISGTPGGPHLCATCRHLSIRKSENGKVMQLCNYTYDRPVRINERTVECNDYEKVNTPSKHEMAQMAWYLNVDRSGRPIGFMPRKEFVAKFGEDETYKGL